jgi:hypothetical protein
MTAMFVELVDGRLVTRDAPQWRDECLARYTLSKPLTERRAWLTDFEKRHGREDTERLMDVMKAVHAKGKA